MTAPENSPVLRLRWIVLAAAVAVLVSFLWQGRDGLNAADEGFLWYGAQRVVAGEVPIRDFMAYDPGRYYWAAAFMGIQGDDGILALREAVAIFQALGLAAGLWVIAGAVARPRRTVWTGLALVSLLVWMYPRHKLFDIAISLGLIAALTALASRPTVRRHFFAGLAVGLAAVFGRNHGIYGLAGSMIALAAIWRLAPDRRALVASLAAWAGGVAAGYAPMLAMIALVPGFAGSFWRGLRFLFEVKTTNLPLPVLWPWAVSRHLSGLAAVRQELIGCWFVLLVAFAVLGLVWLAWRTWRRRAVPPALLASVALGLPYAHYAFSRADLGHLAQGVFPCLVGVWICCGRQRRAVAGAGAALLLGVSLWTVGPAHPGTLCAQAKTAWVEHPVGADRLVVDRGMAVELDRLQDLVGRYAPDGASFVATPFWPGAYAVMHRKSPMWESYALYPRSDAFQRGEIARIEAAAPTLVIVQDLALDGRDELRFRNTHPMIARYFATHFVAVTDRTLPKSWRVYRRRDGAALSP